MGNYKLASAYQRSAGRRGGTVVYVKPEICYKELFYLVNMSVPQVYEIAAVFVQNFNVIYLELYRVQEVSNYDQFIECLYHVMYVLYNKNNTCASIVLGYDSNVDFLVNSVKRSIYLNLLLSFKLKNVVNEITWLSITGLGRGNYIDNIATSIHYERRKSWVEHMVVSDHHAILMECNFIRKINTPVTSVNVSMMQV